jgi:uncharacterized membrane protein YraQ (UPF0718 family)
MTDVMRTRFQFGFQTFLLATVLAAGIIIASPLIDTSGFPMTGIITGVVGLLLQALPFLLVGILISSAVETFITPAFIERHFPKSTAAGMLVALFAGFCIPVCDCATVPVFSRLHRKGVPLPAAIVFLCAAPVINPIVIWSTIFAFPDRPLITVARVSFGIITALIVGVTFVIRPADRHLLREDLRTIDHAHAGGTRHSGIQQGSAIAPGGDVDSSPQCASCTTVPETTRTAGWRTRLISYLNHTRNDLYTIMPYMLVGILVASCVRAFAGSSAPSWLQGYGTPIAIVAMMGLAFLSSLCSSSDAVIARSISALFPTPALLGFLIFGPIMDLKNVLMLRSMFTRRFVWRLGITVAITCFMLMIALALFLELIR